MSNALLHALAEALESTDDTTGFTPLYYEQWADDILAYPAVVAALAGSGPGYAERCPSCGRADEHAAPCTAKVRLPAQSLAEFQAEHPDEFAGSGPEAGLDISILRRVVGDTHDAIRIANEYDRLAATPTASPTAPPVCTCGLAQVYGDRIPWGVSHVRACPAASPTATEDD